MATEERTNASLGDRLFSALQLMLPTRFLSWCMYKITRIEKPWFKDAFIRSFMRMYRIGLDQAKVQDPKAFRHFNEFFTRELKPGVRPLSLEPALLSPVDGTISQFGRIENGRIFQAKGHSYTAIDLLGGNIENATPFLGGDFCTIYLAPYNYHRIHMPANATLRYWRYVPGRLFSVNPATARSMPGLFTRNERIVAVFDTERGPLAMVLVGALFVGSMETVWTGQVTPPHSREADSGNYTPMNPVTLKRGQEMGRFNMGSTVILLHAPYGMQWSPYVRPGATIRMGEELGI